MGRQVKADQVQSAHQTAADLVDEVLEGLVGYSAFLDGRYGNGPGLLGFHDHVVEQEDGGVGGVALVSQRSRLWRGDSPRPAEGFTRKLSRRKFGSFYSLVNFLSD